MKLGCGKKWDKYLGLTLENGRLTLEVGNLAKAEI